MSSAVFGENPRNSNGINNSKPLDNVIAAITRQMFSAKGYRGDEYWKFVDIRMIESRCGLVPSGNGLYFTDLTEIKNRSIAKDFEVVNATGIDLECPAYFISTELENFLRLTNLYYFHIYLSIAIPLIIIAFICNGVSLKLKKKNLIFNFFLF